MKRFLQIVAIALAIAAIVQTVETISANTPQAYAGKGEPGV